MKMLRGAVLAFGLAALASIAGAQTPAMQNVQKPPSLPASGAMAPMDGMPMDHHTGMMMHRSAARGEMPTQPGQAAFGAIQEIVGMLRADPHTDWSKVDIDALRQHLIDMDEVTMRAVAHKAPIAHGLRIRVTGAGRTLAAIQRMVPAHAQDINGLNGWSVAATAIPTGEVLTVTAKNPDEVTKIRALGFMGIMVQGNHQMHHLAMAKGEPMVMDHQPPAR